MTLSEKKNINERPYYQTLMAIAFSLDTGHQYYYHVLKLMIYIFIINWIIMVSKINNEFNIIIYKDTYILIMNLLIKI